MADPLHVHLAGDKSGVFFGRSQEREKETAWIMFVLASVWKTRQTTGPSVPLLVVLEGSTFACIPPHPSIRSSDPPSIQFLKMMSVLSAGLSSARRLLGASHEGMDVVCKAWAGGGSVGILREDDGTVRLFESFRDMFTDKAAEIYDGLTDEIVTDLLETCKKFFAPGPG